MKGTWPFRWSAFLVRQLIEGKGTEHEIARWNVLLDCSIPCPVGYGFDPIVYSTNYDLGDHPTAKAIAEKAMRY